MTETLMINQDHENILEVMLNRPEKRNAISAKMIDELTKFFLELPQVIKAQPSLRALVLRGAGGFFCAGADLAWMKSQFKADRQTLMAEARKFALMLKAIYDSPLPIIAVAEGVVLGGGVGLLCVSDVVIAHPNCLFGLRETHLGIIPATISPYVVGRIGQGHAREIFMSGQLFKSAKAQRLGIVSEISDHIETALKKELAPYHLAAPKAIQAAKRLAASFGFAPSEKEIERTIYILADCWESEEANEGITAFLENRPPQWEKFNS